VPERIGLFGGTFDPPHVGHLVTAVNVRHALNLDRVLLMVANNPWQKEGSRPITPAEDRAALVEAAVRFPSWERFPEVLELSTVIVVDRPGAPVVLPTGIPWVRVEVPRLEVSSTDLRARFSDGRPLDYLVTSPVMEEIRERGLYGVTEAAAK